MIEEQRFDKKKNIYIYIYIYIYISIGQQHQQKRGIEQYTRVARSKLESKVVNLFDFANSLGTRFRKP